MDARAAVLKAGQQFELLTGMGSFSKRLFGDQSKESQSQITEARLNLNRTLDTLAATAATESGTIRKLAARCMMSLARDSDGKC